MSKGQFKRCNIIVRKYGAAGRVAGYTCTLGLIAPSHLVQ